MKRILCRITASPRGLSLHVPVLPALHGKVLSRDGDRVVAEDALAEINRKRAEEGKVPLIPHE